MSHSSRIRWRAAALLLTVFVVMLLPAQAQERFQAGMHYRVLEQPLPTAVPEGSIEVREFFSYACTFCNQFYPLMNRYMASAEADVVLVHHPVIFRADWEPLARAYLVQQVLQLDDQVHGSVFVAIHEENRAFRDDDAVRAFIAERGGVSDSTVDDVWSGFEVETLLRRNEQMARQVGVTGTPSLLVNGKYYVDGRMVGSLDGILQVVDFLIDRERRAQ